MTPEEWLPTRRFRRLRPKTICRDCITVRIEMVQITNFAGHTERRDRVLWHATLASGHVLWRRTGTACASYRQRDDDRQPRRRRAEAPSASTSRKSWSARHASGLLAALGTPDAEVFLSSERQSDRDHPPARRRVGAGLRSRHDALRDLALMRSSPAPTAVMTWSAAFSCGLGRGRGPVTARHAR